MSVMSLNVTNLAGSTFVSAALPVRAGEGDPSAAGAVLELRKRDRNMKLARRAWTAGLIALCCASAAEADVVIGVALPRTGAVAAIGDQVLNGANAAVQTINDKGGINGQKVVLEVQDDACDPKQAVSVANRFAQMQVRLIVGHVCSGASIVASDIYAENGAVMITPASNSAKLTDRGLAGIFRVCDRDDQQGQLSAGII